jgi:type II pantothenate kinase
MWGNVLQGEMSALFLRHEGFLGAVGAFLKVHPMHVPTASSVAAGHARAAAANAADGSSVARQDSRVLHESASTKVRWLHSQVGLGGFSGHAAACITLHCAPHTLRLAHAQQTCCRHFRSMCA